MLKKLDGLFLRNSRQLSLCDISGVILRNSSFISLFDKQYISANYPQLVLLKRLDIRISSSINLFSNERKVLAIVVNSSTNKKRASRAFFSIISSDYIILSCELQIARGISRRRFYSEKFRREENYKSRTRKITIDRLVEAQLGNCRDPFPVSEVKIIMPRVCGRYTRQ